MERAHTVLLNPRQHIREGLQSRDAKAQFDLCYGADDLPGMFRIFMTAEARPGLSGALRRSFFREVICRAQELYEADVKALSREEAESSEILSVAHSPLSRSVVIQHGRAWNPISSSTLPPLHITFDHAEEFCRSEQTRLGNEDILLCRVLQLQAVFSGLRILGIVFSSSTIPAHYSFPPGALRTRCKPFCELKFDLMAPENPASSVASRTVWQVASWEHNCMLGRPLWNALHESGHDFDAILREAKTLLLGVAPEDLAVPPAGGACLATIEQCISHRIAFAIIPPYTRNLREYEATFLERHGGVCLDMNLDPRVLKVGAPSEPILSIAASNLIHKDGLDPSLALLRTLRSMLSARPHSATLVAENLILDSMFYADRTRWPSQCSDNRFVPPVVSVVNLLKSFLAHPEDALRSGPSELGLTGSPRSTFAAEFSESYIYLTHFVTVTDPMSILSHDYMLRAMSRGAGIVVTYPDSFENVAFEGATIFIPFLYKTTELLPYSLSAIAVRVTDSIPDFPTTSQTYHEEMLGRMEDRMLSFVGGVVGVPGPASPIIRILMSFSDPQSGPGYHVVHPSGDTQVEGPMPLLDSYDIWCQGLSPSLYRSVSDGQVERYRRVLEFQCWARKDWDITKQRDPCSPFRPWMDPITASQCAYYLQHVSSGQVIDLS